MKLDLRFYFSIFLRRLPYFLVVLSAVTALGVGVALLLPTKYRAQALLLIEQEQIPGELASSTVQTGDLEQLQIITQQITTRGNMIDLANRFGIYADQPGIEPNAVVNDMRARLRIDPVTGRDRATTVNVSFDGTSPQQAFQVTNAVVTMILQENVQMRTGRAAQTLEFFRQEVDRLGADLDRMGAVILAFQSANQESLPDSIPYLRARQTTLLQQTNDLQRAAAALTDRRARLVELYERTGRVDFAPDQRTPEQRQLQELQNEHEAALLVYSPQNPRIRAIETRIEALQRVVAAQGGIDPALAGAPSQFELQLAEIDGELEYNAAQQEMAAQELATIQSAIAASPANAARLAELDRDQSITRGQYNLAVDRLARAQTGERIELLSRGQRISVIEQAVLPVEPASPNRPLIAAGSLAGGLFLGLGLVLLLEMFNSAIRRPSEIQARLGVQPLATLPYIRTRRQQISRRSVVTAAVLVAVIGTGAALFAFDQFVLPMDRLVSNVMDKTGLTQLFH